MQAVTEGPGFVAAIHFLRQLGLLAGPLYKLAGAEALRRLGRAAIDLAHHHVAIQVHVHAQLDDLMGSRPAQSIRSH